MKLKKFLVFFLSFIITIGAAIYQRKTGPTYPKEVNVELNSNVYTVELPRSHGGETDCPVMVPIADSTVKGSLYFRRYPTNESWQRIPLTFQEDKLVGYLPNQPPAGKLEYYLEFTSSGTTTPLQADTPIRIRFKGAVPTSILIPHVILIFLAMYFSTAAGLFALFGMNIQRPIAFTAFLLLFLGGMIFGPIMQYYAFGEFWTGIPFGWDLTDNKTLIAFIGWAVAIGFNWRRQAPKATVAAALLLMLIFSIPHSVMGSERNPETGQITTG